MKRLLYAVLLLTLLIASCSPVIPPGTISDAFDWCYIYDFTESIDGVHLVNGIWDEGVGLLTDGSGLLELDFAHTTDVYPNRAIIDIDRAPGVSGNVDIEAAAYIYGIPFSTASTIPGIISDIPPYVLPPQPFTTPYGSTVQLYLYASQGMVIRSLEVRGSGASPFLTNPCAIYPTETPTKTYTPSLTYTPTPSLTPSMTMTPSLTPAVTNTPSLTPTPTCAAGLLFDHSFSGGQQGWSLNQTPSRFYGVTIYGTWSGSGWLPGKNPGDNGHNVEAIYNFGADVKVCRIEYYAAAGSGSFYAMLVNSSNSTVYNSGLVNVIVNPNYVTADKVIVGRTHNLGATTQIDRIAVYGYYINQTATPTFTPTPTWTLTPTNTRRPFETGTPVPGVPSHTYTPIVPLTRTPNPTFTPIPPSSTALPVTSTSSRTPIPSPTLFLTPTFLPTTEGEPPPGDGPYENEGEWAILDAISQFFNWVTNTVNNLFDSITQGWNWLGGTISNLITTVTNSLQGLWQIVMNVLSFLQGLVEIVRLVVAVFVGLIQRLAGYLQQVFAILGLLLTSYYNAPVLPIPGLPTCATNPIASDVCAIYYILDHTFLAPNTPGAFIVPILAATASIIVMITVVKFVLKIVRRGEKVTNVG